MLGIDLITAGTLLTLAAGNGSPYYRPHSYTPKSQQQQTQQQPVQQQSQQRVNACPFVKPAAINVIPSTQAVRYDYSKTLAQLQATDTDTINPYGFHGVSVVQGFMQGQISVKPSIKYATQTFPSTGLTCISYDSINVPIEIKPIIVIAKEVYNNACMRKQVVDHEMKHVNVDRKIVNTYSKIIGQKIYKALEDRGFRAEPVPVEQAQSMADRMSKVVMQVVETEYKRLDLDRTEQQRAVDSLEEYNGISEKCPEFMNDMPQWSSSVKQQGKSSAPPVYRPRN